MINLAEQTKMKRLRDLSESEKQDIFLKLISHIAKFKGTKHDSKDLLELYDQVKYFIDTKFAWIKVHELLVIVERGMIGEYGKEFKFCADTFVNWLGQHQRETAQDRFRDTVKKSEETRPLAEITQETRLYAKAVLVRTCCDPGGEICKNEKISIDDIAEGLKKDLNILTGSKYSEKECYEIARKNVSNSVLFTKSNR